MKWAPILYNAKIPWTTVFGNHDDEKTDMSHDEQINLMKTLPYYLGEIGPTNVDGSGNYVRSIRAADGDTVLTTLYFLDSHVSSLFARARIIQRADTCDLSRTGLRQESHSLGRQGLRLDQG